MNVFVRILQLCLNVFSLIFFFSKWSFYDRSFFFLFQGFLWFEIGCGELCFFFLKIKKNHCWQVLNDGLRHTWTARTEHLHYICICMHGNMKHTSFQMFLSPLRYFFFLFFFFFFFFTLLCLISLLLLSGISLSPCFYLSDQATHLSSCSSCFIAVHIPRAKTKQQQKKKTC